MRRNECCSSLVASSATPPAPSSSSAAGPATSPSTSAAAAANYANLSIDERDELMKNLQKLFKAHQREQLEQLQQQQPGCSSSISNTTKGNVTSDLLTSLLHQQPSSSSNSSNFIPSLAAVSADDQCSPLKSTILDGKLVACFMVGGECRLCFPQMRALTLGDVPTQTVDEAMKTLAIMNGLANEEQLSMMKRAGVVQNTVARCELITKTNAERLLSVLKSCGTPPLNELERSRLHFIKVAHDCFGGCTALLYPGLVPHPCLECRTCHRMFSPEDFCRHTHRPAAGNNLCFWGFDASNWAYYIRIDDEEQQEGGGEGMMDVVEQQLAIFVQNYPTTTATMATSSNQLQNGGGHLL